MRIRLTIMKIYYTFDSDASVIFRKIERAAQYALDYGYEPNELLILEDGRVRPAINSEIHDLAAHMRDQSPPC